MHGLRTDSQSWSCRSSWIAGLGVAVLVLAQSGAGIRSQPAFGELARRAPLPGGFQCAGAAINDAGVVVGHCLEGPAAGGHLTAVR